MLTVLCLAVLGGLSVARLLRGRAPRTIVAVVVLGACALLIDGWVVIPLAPIPAPPAAVIPAPDKPVAVLPVGDLERDVGVVYYSVTQGWSAINGYSGYEPGYYEAVRTLSETGDPTFLAPFSRRADIQIVDDRGVVRTVPQEADSTHQAQVARERLSARGYDASCSPESMRYATDGDLDTRWVCGIQLAPHHIAFDLGETAEVGVVVHALGSQGTDFPRYLVIDTSRDGTTWEAAWEGSPAAAVLDAAMEAPRLTRVMLPFAARDARYVRLRQTGRSGRTYWSMAELQVWTGSKPTKP